MPERVAKPLRCHQVQQPPTAPKVVLRHDTLEIVPISTSPPSVAEFELKVETPSIVSTDR